MRTFDSGEHLLSTSETFIWLIHSYLWLNQTLMQTCKQVPVAMFANVDFLVKQTDTMHHFRRLPLSNFLIIKLITIQETSQNIY